MSNFKTHTRINLILALPLLLGGAYYFFSPKPIELVTFGCCFIYGTLFMSPDVDLASQIKLFSIRGLFTLPFRSYALFFRHRGLSHSLIFGTLTRVIWLGLHALLFAYLVYQIQPDKQTFWKFIQYYKAYIIFGVSGLFLADTAHLAVDHLRGSSS